MKKEEIIEKVKRIAYQRLEELDYEVKENIWLTLHTVKFNFPNGFISQREFAKLNLLLDERSCVGRGAQIGALIEKHFPNIQFKFGDVLEDFFAKNFLRGSGRSHEDLQAILTCEEPHNIVLIDGDQFDPLSALVGGPVVHPKVLNLPFWETIAADYLVSQAYLEEDLPKREKLLFMAKELSPELSVVRENLVKLFLEKGEDEKAIQIAKECLEKRPCARTLYVLYCLTQKKIYWHELSRIYSAKIIKYIQEGI